MEQSEAVRVLDGMRKRGIVKEGFRAGTCRRRCLPLQRVRQTGQRRSDEELEVKPCAEEEGSYPGSRRRPWCSVPCALPLLLI